MKDIYANDPEMQVLRANRTNNVNFLRRVFLEEKKLDILRVKKDTGWSRLHSALMVSVGERAGVEVVQFYIDHGVSVNAQDGFNYTPLHFAVMFNGKVEVVKALLEAGADPNLEDNDHANALDAAFGHKTVDLQIFELLLQYGADGTRTPSGRGSRSEAIDFVLENAILTEEKRENLLAVKGLLEKYKQA